MLKPWILIVILVGAAILGYLLLATPPAESSNQGFDAAGTESLEVQPAAALPMAPSVDTLQRDALPQEVPEIADSSEVTAATTFLRVILEGISEEEARASTIQMRGMRSDRSHINGLQRSWNAVGKNNTFAIDSFLRGAAEGMETSLPLDKLDVLADHPLLLGASVRIALDQGSKQADGTLLYEARLRLIQPEFWPEFTLSVLDATTRKHLKDVELRSVPTSFMGIWRQPGLTFPYEHLGAGLPSPIIMVGAHEPGEPEDRIAGMTLFPEAEKALGMLEFDASIRVQSKRGLLVYARAPGYAWGNLVLDVSTGADRELLLGPEASLDVQLENVQLARYAALEEASFLTVYQHDEDGSRGMVRSQRLEETLEADGLQLDGIQPGDYSAAVEMGDAWWQSHRPVLARETFSLAAGEHREIVLVLQEPPAPAVQAPLGGVVSLPKFEQEDLVRLEAYHESNAGFRDPDISLSLAELTRVGGDLPTWSFRMEDLPVGRYRLQLLPFMHNWVVELPETGLTDLELMLPEIAEVFVETVDAQSGERAALHDFYFRHQDPVVGRASNDWMRAEMVEPGSFRFWTTPGEVSIWPRNQGTLGYGLNWMRVDLVPGQQSVQFELHPIYAIHMEFREGEAVLPIGPQGMMVQRDIRPVGHEGRVTGDGLQTDMRVEVSAPGFYEIDFDGVTGDVFQPIPRRQVHVQAGEVIKVVVDLVRK